MYFRRGETPFRTGPTVLNPCYSCVSVWLGNALWWPRKPVLATCVNLVSTMHCIPCTEGYNGSVQKERKPVCGVAIEKGWAWPNQPY